ncbi:MAG: hypothetical protein QOJ85_1489 [Solirubrobacteraceae bacterium]|nr:hypothetical protein [Solirubrobacteraceae bacterium]
MTAAPTVAADQSPAGRQLMTLSWCWQANTPAKQRFVNVRTLPSLNWHVTGQNTSGQTDGHLTLMTSGAGFGAALAALVRPMAPATTRVAIAEPIILVIIDQPIVSHAGARHPRVRS